MGGYGQAQLQLLTSPQVSGAGRRIALFPGSFKPPHRGHYEGVVSLLARDDVDEVVVIISARSRRLPGSNLALDASGAASLWQLMLEGNPRVTIEVAKDSAIRHALDYFTRVTPADSLLFCVGEADFFSDDCRFERIEELKQETGIDAAVHCLPPTEMRATAVRRLLALGETGRSKFMHALPAHFSRRQREGIWTCCQDSIKDIYAITAAKLTPVLAPLSLDPQVGLVPVEGAALEFRGRNLSGEWLRVKYAGDEIPVAGAVPGLRRRLSVAKRALRYLGGQHLDDITVAELVLFDKRTRTLVETEPFPPATSLLQRYLVVAQSGDSDLAARLGRACARLHRLPAPLEPLRGSWAEDEAWWRQHVQSVFATRDDPLLEEVREAAQRGFVHLALSGESLRLFGDHIELTGLESSSAFGDPAYDVATLINSCAATARAPVAGLFVEGLLAGYAEVATESESLVRRARLLAVRMIHTAHKQKIRRAGCRGGTSGPWS